MSAQPLAVATPHSQNILHVRNVGKEYRLYPNPRERLKALLTRRAKHQSHWALRDVSFDLKRGQCIGVIGDNGAGKSTLLKLLAGTLQPSHGSIDRVGRVTAILELGAGFHPEFSGRDNLYFGGGLIGISREEMQRLEPEICAFAELGDAMDRPVKTYSSGMTVRLAFALVTAVPPDLLIIDEALAVGDQQFQKKCVERILSFRKQGCSILFCSHSPYHIRQLCDVALWLDRGQVQRLGDTEAVLGAYDVHTRLDLGDAEAVLAQTNANAALEQTDSAATTARLVQPPSATALTTTARLLSVDIDHLQQADATEVPLLSGHDLVVHLHANGQGEEAPNLGFMIEQSRGTGITSLATHDEGVTPKRQPDGSWRLTLTFPDLPLHTGEYVVSAFLFDGSGLVVYEQWYQFLTFRFVAPTFMPGLVRLPHRWE